MRVEVSLNKWGNSLGIRLPKWLVRKYDLGKGSKLTIHEVDDGILLKPRDRVSLKSIIDSYPDGYEPEPEIFQSNWGKEDWDWNQGHEKHV